MLDDVFRYDVENDVKCPPRTLKGGHSFKSPFPFQAMNVGQSFFVPYEDLGNKGGYISISAAIAAHQRSYHGRRFTWRTRYQSQHGETGWRVWRIA